MEVTRLSMEAETKIRLAEALKKNCEEDIYIKIYSKQQALADIYRSYDKLNCNSIFGANKAECPQLLQRMVDLSQETSSEDIEKCKNLGKFILESPLFPIQGNESESLEISQKNHFKNNVLPELVQKTQEPNKGLMHTQNTENILEDLWDS
jgi:hypothetical protein